MQGVGEQEMPANIFLVAMADNRERTHRFSLCFKPVCLRSLALKELRATLQGTLFQDWRVIQCDSEVIMIQDHWKGCSNYLVRFVPDSRKGTSTPNHSSRKLYRVEFQHLPEKQDGPMLVPKGCQDLPNPRASRFEGPRIPRCRELPSFHKDVWHRIPRFPSE